LVERELELGARDRHADDHVCAQCRRASSLDLSESPAPGPVSRELGTCEMAGHPASADRPVRAQQLVLPTASRVLIAVAVATSSRRRTSPAAASEL
jgi:hypothetical protein